MARRPSPLFSNPFSSRKGFELAISTIVVIVLGIIVIGGGIAILATLQDSAPKISDKITSDQRAHLKTLLSDGQLVAIYPSSLRLSKDEAEPVALMVDNQLPTAQAFTIHTAVEKNGAPSTLINVTSRASFNSIESRGKGETVVIAQPKTTASSGEYIVLVWVEDRDGKIYDSKRFFTVYVP